MKHSHEPLRRVFLYFSATVFSLSNMLALWFILGGLELTVTGTVSLITGIAGGVGGLIIFEMVKPTKEKLLKGSWEEAFEYFERRAVVPGMTITMLMTLVIAKALDWPMARFVISTLTLFGTGIGMLWLSKRMGKWFSKLEVATTPEKEEPRA